MNPQRDQEDSNSTDNTEYDNDTRVLRSEVLSLDKLARDKYGRHFEIGVKCVSQEGDGKPEDSCF